MTSCLILPVRADEVEHDRSCYRVKDVNATAVLKILELWYVFVMKYSIRSLTMLIGIAAILISTVTLAYHQGFKNGHKNALKVIAASESGFCIDLTTDDLLDELLAELSPKTEQRSP